MRDELSDIVNPTLRERIDKAIVNFWLGAPIKAKKPKILMNLQRNSINQSLENFRGDST